MKKEELLAVLEQFLKDAERFELYPYGNGHINDTYQVVDESNAEAEQYILQRINTAVFTKPKELMENVCAVTQWIGKKLQESGKDPKKGTLTILKTKNGESSFQDEKGNYWRVYTLIQDTVSYDTISDAKDFYESAFAFGQFQQQLADYPVESLHETIPDFHNTPKRFEAFQKAVETDVCNRAHSAESEINFVRERAEFAHILQDLVDKGEMPQRVTHNDTKLNNILMDKKTGKGVCVIDLDTVMPGMAVHDFGDAIRFGANTGAEDERDLSRVSCDLNLYRAYLEGFLAGCNHSLTETEISHLHTGAMMMTFECGMRFLTDYLEGDHYFKIACEDHNLVRCRSQFALLKDMEEKKEQMLQMALDLL